MSHDHDDSRPSNVQKREQNVEPIVEGMEVIDRTVGALYSELQEILYKYENAINEAEAIGVLEMLKTKIFTEHRYEVVQE